MSQEVAISVRNVSKRYYIFENQSARLLKAFWPKSRSGVSEIWALRDVSLDIKKGEAVAIIGRNGSGKSTLLEIITGLLKPTAGEVDSSGRIAALLQLGSGFNPEYTGRENVFLNGLLMGLTRLEVENRFDEIAAFADIGDVLNQPVKTYSSGMLVRLAFAVQVALDPDILIIDEALSVGDYFFRQKCFGRINQLREDGMTLLFVTHDLNTVTNVCDRAIYLHQGVLCDDGKPNHVIRSYLGMGPNALKKDAFYASDIEPSHFLANLSEPAQWRRQNLVLDETGGLLAVSILNAEGDLATNVHIKEKISVRIYFVPDAQKKAHVYLQIKNAFNESLFTTGTYYLDMDVSELQSDQVALLQFDLEMSLGGGGYSFLVMMAYPEPPNSVGEIFDRTSPIGPMMVGGDYGYERVPFLGPFGLPVEACLKQAKSDD